METNETTEQELIGRWIKPHPGKSGRAEAVLAGHGVSVWVLVNYWLYVNGDVKQVMEAYDVPQQALEATLAF